MRFPNSTSEWNWSGGVRWPWVQSGQSAQPRPEPVSRTAAPVTTMSATMTRDATQSRRKAAAGTVGRRRAQPVPPGAVVPDTRAHGTGAGRSPHPGPRRAPGPRVPARPPRAPPGGHLLRPTAWLRGRCGRRLSAMASEAPALRGSGPPGSRLGAYVALTKPRIIELLLVTTLPTMVVAERGPAVAGPRSWPRWWAAPWPPAVPTPSTCTWTGTSTGVMHRTRNRPLVTGAVTPRAALTFAVSLEIAGLRRAVAAGEPAVGRPRRLGHRASTCSCTRSG